MSPKILYVAPLRDFSGYATASRDYVRALDSVGCNIVTRTLNYDGGQCELSNREKELINKDLQDVDIVIQHTTPNETVRKDGLFNVCYFAWETDRVPDEWVKKINTMDLALVPCDENLKAARVAGVHIPIVKVPHTFDKGKYIEREEFKIPNSNGKFKFLSICQISKKKGLDSLLKGFFSEFRSSDNVMLILKAYFGSSDTEEHRNKMISQINKMKELLRINSYPNVFLVSDILSEEAIARLYSSVDCYVLPSRGEGWGIPHFDAMGFGVPPISTGWGGPTEFITKDCGWLVDYTMSPCFDMPHPHPFMYTGNDNWAEPNVLELRRAMRDAYNEWCYHQLDSNNSRWSNRIKLCKERVNDFSYDKIGVHMRDSILYYYKKWKMSNGY
jgi:glycosyltransferase involved in cell wall biosynthesis